MTMYAIIESMTSHLLPLTTETNTNKTIGESYKKARDEALGDPVQAKIVNWTEGKENNLRALLSSLQDVLWEGEERWKKVTI